MGLMSSKDQMRRKIDECTSNSSLSNMRYITAMSAKPKWKVFGKKEAPISVYPSPRLGAKGCPCGQNGPCKQKVTPRGVTIHYPQPKKKKFPAFRPSRYTPPKSGLGQAYYNTKPRVNVVKQKRFPTWRVDNVKNNTPFAFSPGEKIITPRPYKPARK